MSNSEESGKNFHRSKMFREKVTAGLDSRLDAQEELLELVLQNLRWPIISKVLFESLPVLVGNN